MCLYAMDLWITPIRSMRSRRWGGAALAGLLLTVVGAACTDPNPPLGTPVEQAWESPAAREAAVSAVPPEPATAPEDEATTPAEPVEPVMAVVNGRPLSRNQLVDLLIESHGLGLLEQMILLTAAKGRATEMGLNVTPADVKAAHEDALRRISQPMGGEGVPLDRPVAERLLREFLQAKNISQAEWNLRMEQQAWVRKIAEAEVEQIVINERMLREEYGRAYGERVQIRHIQVSSLAAVERVRSALQRKGDFAAVAREMSENQITAANGGLLEPFTYNESDVPPLIREAAFRMKPGEISPTVQQENWYHILKCERRFPASGVSFENVDREVLKSRLKDRLIRQRQETLEEELVRSANVDIRNGTRRKQFKEKHQR